MNEEYDFLLDYFKDEGFSKETAEIMAEQQLAYEEQSNE